TVASMGRETGSMAPPGIVIFSGSTGWHEERLAGAFARKGVASCVVSLTDCRFGPLPPGIEIPGFAHGLPDAALVRAIPDGSFEQVTLRLDILHALREHGVLVYNDARAQ